MKVVIELTSEKFFFKERERRTYIIIYKRFVYIMKIRKIMRERRYYYYYYYYTSF